MRNRQGWSVWRRWEQAKALAGDMQAARIILDRLVPSLKPVEMPAEPVAASYLNLGNLCSLRLAFLR